MSCIRAAHQRGIVGFSLAQLPYVSTHAYRMTCRSAQSPVVTLAVPSVWRGKSHICRIQMSKNPGLRQRLGFVLFYRKYKPPRHLNATQSTLEAFDADHSPCLERASCAPFKNLPVHLGIQFSGQSAPPQIVLFRWLVVHWATIRVLKRRGTPRQMLLRNSISF